MNSLLIGHSGGAHSYALLNGPTHISERLSLLAASEDRSEPHGTRHEERIWVRLQEDVSRQSPPRQGGHMKETEILTSINDLMAEERELREREVGEDPKAVSEEHSRLRVVEQQLDQCWDLLRQRRAKKEFGEDPETARSRPINEVESYLQ